MDRIERLLTHLRKPMRIVEIGPSHSPIAPKSDGWHTTVVDHATREDLVAKYTGHGVNLARLEPVDVLWSGGDLASNFPRYALGTYDAVLASHVLEHMPDPISFLKSSAALLNENGIIVLATPDKRYCFDFFSPMTATGDWLAAHEIKARTHPKRVAFNHQAYASCNHNEIGWGHAPLTDLRLVHTLKDAAAHFQAAEDTGGGEYADYHAWRLTPSIFQLIVLEVAILCDIDLHVAECTPALGHEFFAVLKRGRPVFETEAALEARRLELLRASIGELRQQTMLLPDVA